MTRLQPAHRRTTARAAALIASAAVVAVGVQTGTADADTPREAGATAVALSAPQRAAALQEAQTKAADTARAITLGDREALIARDVVKDADGTVHTRYERTYAGLPVLGGDLVVHEKRDGARSTTKATDARISVASTTPAVAATTAGQAAATSSRAKDAKADTTRKVIWAATGKPVLAWETVVTGTQTDGTPSRRHVITDADSGKELFSYESIRTGIGNSLYSGQVSLGTSGSNGTYTLTDAARGGSKTYDLNGGTSGTGTLFTNSTDVWGNGLVTHRESAAADAHYAEATTWDFYKNELGRNGVRGDGKAANSRVHYGINYANAFFDGSCYCMTYGDGYDNAHPLTATDIAAHEMSHGVTAATAGLIYSGESGGLNEATSDILGTSAEFHAGNATDVGDYLIGENIDANGTGNPLRYMDKPSKDGVSKDFWYSGIGNVDVHYSSGLANHFFYLLAEGSGPKVVNGVPYDSPTANNVTVTGIGRVKAYKIWYRALATKFTSSTNYAAARTGTLAAAADLYGPDSPEYAAVANAWRGVNVG
ncbi:thermolysin metallopeptidase [Streptomyces laurentii]|uniref:Neutral metalloproteinase n=1 Tax=Streptomyces laurentii TaxID=39478 RepID=A0A169PNK2_STRLU|nr:thermolysin metallopeptidase [Streptomyces laurentii]